MGVNAIYTNLGENRINEHEKFSHNRYTYDTAELLNTPLTNSSFQRLPFPGITSLVAIFLWTTTLGTTEKLLSLELCISQESARSTAREYANGA